MTNLASSRSYNFGDTFGDPVETNPVPADTLVEGAWRIQASAAFEQDDAAWVQGGAA